MSIGLFAVFVGLVFVFAMVADYGINDYSFPGHSTKICFVIILILALCEMSYFYGALAMKDSQFVKCEFKCK